MKPAIPLRFGAATLLAAFACATNQRPDVPTVPSGPDYCLKDTVYTFTTVVSDADDDSVAVRFDWGDSASTYWQGWFASGDTVAFTHAWSDTGNYEVRVSAQDRERTSDLSDGLKVRVTIRWPPETPAAPTGPNLGGQDSSYTFLAGADHPDNIPVAIRFAWSDGDTSDWSDFVLSGGPVSAKHAWSAPDTYAVTAQARDTGGLTSLWSPPHTFVVRPRDTLLLWRVRLTTSQHSSMTSSPAIGRYGTVHVGSSEGCLYAVGPSGVISWRYQAGGSILSSPAIATDGTVYFGSNDNCLHAVNWDGTLKWKYLTGGGVRSSPAIAADGTIYVGSEDNRLYALNPDGTLKWTYLTGDRIGASPAVAADGTVYFGSHDGYFYAIRPDGASKWRYVSGTNAVFASPAIGSDGTIYCGARVLYSGGLLCALKPDGSLRWSLAADGAISSSPAIAVDGIIYFGTSGGAWGGGSSWLHAVNSDGTPKWSFAPGSPICNSSPAVNADGTIYVGSYDRGLCAVYPDGAPKWRYQTAGDIESSPTIGSDGTIYFASTDGYLYALKGTSPLANSPWPKFQHDLRNSGRSDEGGWSGLRTVGPPVLAADSSGFLIKVVNDGIVEDTVSGLLFYDTPESAYMRDFVIDGNHGIGYPIPHGQNGTGPGDTVRFAPVTIAPYGTQLVELRFFDFHVDEDGDEDQANVSGKVFVFRFDNSAVIVVRP